MTRKRRAELFTEAVKHNPGAGGGVITLGIDPGANPGYATWFEGEGFAYRTFADAAANFFDVDRIVTEGTWHRPAPKGREKGKGATPANIAKLSLTCGMQLMRAMYTYPNARAYRLPVDVWKNAVVYGGARIPKEAFVQRLRKAHALPEHWTEDQVEAFGLTLAADKLPPATLEKYRVKEPK